MDLKIIVSAVIVGMAVLIPAPIPSVDQKHPITPESSQESLAKQQAVTGKIGIVGAIPEKVSETGMALMDNSVKHDDSAVSGMNAANSRADRVGQNAIAVSTQRISEEKKQEKSFGLWAILVCFSGIVIWKIIQHKIEKATPMPELTKTVVDRFV